MDLHPMMKRVTAVLLVAALATAMLAPAAEAGRRHRRVVRHGAVIERHSEAGAVFGFLGGLVLGAVIANAQQPQPACPRERAYGYDDYAYYDPYCRETFGSLDRYGYHLDRHRHPRTAEVVDARSGRRLDTVRWYDGEWVGQDGRGGPEPVVQERRGDAPEYEDWDD